MRFLHTDVAHQDVIVSLAFSPDSRRIVSGSWDGTAKVWDLKNGELLHTLSWGADSVDAVAWSPDDRLVAVSGGSLGWPPGKLRAPSQLRLYDAETGSLERILAEDEFRCLAFSPDGQTLAAGGGISLGLFNLTNRRCVWAFENEDLFPQHLFFSMGGKKIACVGSGGVWVFDARSGELLRIVRDKYLFYDDDLKTLESLNAPVTRLPDERDSVTPPKSALYRLRFWRRMLPEFLPACWAPPEATIGFICFSPDRRWAVAERDSGPGWNPTAWHRGGLSGFLKNRKRPKWFLPATGHPFNRHRFIQRFMAFSPDSRHLAIAGDEQTITLLNARSGRRVKKIGSPPPAILSVAVSRTEPFVAAAASDGKVRLCDYQQRKIVAVSESMESPIVHTEFSPNGDILVAASQRGRVRVLNVHGLQTITEFQAHHDEFCGGALSACGQRFISVGYESKQREPWLFPAGVDTVDLSPTKMQPPQSAKSPWDRDARIVEWSLYDGRPLRQCDLPGEFRVRSVAASPARRKLAIASSKELAIADIQPADQRAINVHRMSHPEILEIAFVNNSQLLMGYEGYRIRRFDVQEKTPIGDLINPIFDDPTAFAFITGGSAFAVSSAYQSDILLFELATGSLQEVLMGHQNHVRALAVSPDERLLMSGGADGTLKLWDIRRGDLLASMIF